MKLAFSFNFKYDHTEEMIRPWDKQKKIVDLCLLTRNDYKKEIE